VYGYQWDSELYIAAAEEGVFELIKWLHQVRCPSPTPFSIAHACSGCISIKAVSILQWLHSLQPEWLNKVNNARTSNSTMLLGAAGASGSLAVMQWLRFELKADWPAVADIICSVDEVTIIPDWDVGAVIWALDNGLQFEFDCSKLDPDKQTLSLYKKEAAVLWQWLHKESNRHHCTCSSAL
jgi:hypothetical protein